MQRHPISLGEAELEQIRACLKRVASARVRRRLRQRLDVSGIVQNTLLEAHRDWPQLRDQAPPSRLHWLRRIFVHNLADALRSLRSRKRDVRRERSLDDLLARAPETSAAGAPDGGGPPTPSSIVYRKEMTLRVAAALATLPEAQREALVLQYWQGCSLTQIAQRMGRTPAAVAGLLKRGMKQLRLRLEAKEQI